MRNRTTIQIEKDVRERLKNAKKYPRETYQDTIRRLLRKKNEQSQKSFKV